MPALRRRWPRSLPKTILKSFYRPLRTGKVGQPKHLPWPDLHIVQLIKTRTNRKVVKLTRTLVHGSQQRVEELIAFSQTTLGLINTAYIERLNATFRANLPSLARRTRRSARTSTSSVSLANRTPNRTPNSFGGAPFTTSVPFTIPCLPPRYGRLFDRPPLVRSSAFISLRTP